MTLALATEFSPDALFRLWEVSGGLGLVILGAVGMSVFYARRRQKELNHLREVEDARLRRRARRQRQETERQASTALAVRDRSGRRTKRRALVLVVDDSPTVLIAARKALENESYRVITSESGREAWNVLQDEHPDLIISDIEMPNVNGFQLLKLVREDLELADLPVMLMTSHLYYDVKMGQAAGANAFLTKPYEADDLIEQVRYLIPD
jgi:CheY-like chemotaxis protein